MALSSTHDLTVNVPYVHFLPQYRPQLEVSLSPEHDPKFSERASRDMVYILYSETGYLSVT
jgi:hypothetical protein